MYKIWLNLNIKENVEQWCNLNKNADSKLMQGKLLT